MTPESALRLEDWTLERRSGDRVRTVLAGIDLDIRTGRWTALLGANGSGKSSLLRFLASEQAPTEVETGLVFQDPDEQIFTASVARELTLGRPGLEPEPILRRFGLAGTARQDPRLLSAGQKQRLALAVATADDPVVLLCDEPTALQDPVQAAWVLDEIDRWRRESDGAVVTATCDRREAMRADWLVVLEEGRIRCQGPTSDLLDRPEATALLGGGSSREPGRFVETGNTATLTLEEVGYDFPGARSLADLDLRVGPGQRLGICGPNGCGKSTLLAGCAGVRRPDRGRIRLCGHLLYAGGARDLDHGRALLAPQFPEYLFSRSTVGEEITLDPAYADREPQQLLERLGLPAELIARNPHDLSCGQKRRLALGMVIFGGRPLVILDEPTAALDRAGRALVLELLDELPPATTLIVASHDRDFLAAAGCGTVDLGDFLHRSS